jgi:ketosteroid isomerase-like protein
MSSLGEQFVSAIAKRDRDGLRQLLADDVDFQGLTPKRLWTATSADEVDGIVFANWFEDDENITAVPMLETGHVAGVDRVGYRYEVDTPNGPRVVEQQAYYKVKDDRIAHMRIACSGFRIP